MSRDKKYREKNRDGDSKERLEAEQRERLTSTESRTKGGKGKKHRWAAG